MKPIRHYPARTRNQPPRWYALCGYESADKREFANPAKPEQVTCEACRDYDRIKSAENWLINTYQPEGE